MYLRRQQPDCVTGTTFTVIINPTIPPTFPFNNNVSLCEGDAAPVLTTTSTNGIKGVWSPAVVSNTTNGIYLLHPTPGSVRRHSP